MFANTDNWTSWERLSNNHLRPLRSVTVNDYFKKVPFSYKLLIMKLEDVKDKIDNWFESAECIKYFDELEDANQIREQRFRRLENWIEINDFDKLMYRLILEHGDNYIENCHHNGYEAYANNKLSFLISYITKNTEIIHVKKLRNDFTNNIWEFKGYYFQFIYGQGTIIRIYNKDDLRLLLQL